MMKRQLPSFTDAENEILLLDDLILSSPVPQNCKLKCDGAILEPTIAFNSEKSIQLTCLDEKNLESHAVGVDVQSFGGDALANGSSCWIPVTTSTDVSREAFASMGSHTLAGDDDVTTPPPNERTYSKEDASESLKLFTPSFNTLVSPSTLNSSISEVPQRSVSCLNVGDRTSMFLRLIRVVSKTNF